MARTIRALAVFFLAVLPTAAYAGAASVHFQGGLVSATFDATPAPEALDALRRATGMEVVLPPSAQRQTLTLGVEQAPFEQFLQRVLAALDLGGFALVYAPGGGADRLIVVDKGRGAEAPAPARPQGTTPPVAEARGAARAGRVPVPFLIRKPEGDSIKLGAPGQVIVVESAPFAKTTTSECDGSPGRYPVQTVLVTEAAKTYIASIIVCNAGGLGSGQTLAPQRLPTDAEGASTYARFSATPQ